MVKSRVYVETTVPSFYHETRTAPDIVARREWTRQWWANSIGRHEHRWNYSEGAMNQDRTDPVSDEIRDVRQRIAARFDNDPTRLVEHYMKLQEQHAERLIHPPKAARPSDESAA